MAKNQLLLCLSMIRNGNRFIFYDPFNSSLEEKLNWRKRGFSSIHPFENPTTEAIWIQQPLP